MRFFVMIVCLFSCSLTTAQEPLPVPSVEPPVNDPVAELVMLISHRDQLIAINDLSQSMITSWLQEIAVAQANLTFLQSIANPTPEQVMQMAALQMQIAQKLWQVEYHMGLIENRNVMIFNLNQQIDNLLSQL